MNVPGPAHPLDVDLADHVEGMVDATRAAQLEAHLDECRLCRDKRRRLLRAPPAGPADGGLPAAPAFPVPACTAAGAPAPGELWLAGPDERLLVLVLRVRADRVEVAPVTLGAGAADEEAVIVDAQESPCAAELAIYPELATEVPRSVLLERVGSALADAASSAGSGTSIVDASDPRLEVRQALADALGSLEERAPDPGTAADAPPPGSEHRRSALVADIRALRGDISVARPLYGWGDVWPPRDAGWEPLATVEEVGVVLVVLDTPHGLVDDADFDAARSVLTRFNANALVVLAGPLGDSADVFDSPSLNHGIDAPSGRHTPPRPLISGLSPFDATSKYLDQSTGARAVDPPRRGPVSRVDVNEILAEAAAAALAGAVRQGARFKIAPKRRGYESLAGNGEAFQSALRAAFGPGSVVDDLLALAPDTDG